MIQLLYISSAVATPATADILAVSRRNNARDRITGLLYADGRRFLQVLEGPDEAVARAFARIGADPRHRAIVQLSRREIAERAFGPWDMALRAPGQDEDAFLARVDALLAGAAPAVRGTFEGLTRLRRAA